VVLAERAVVRPSGVAPAPDGSVYVSEEATQRVYRVAPDGTRTQLPLDLIAPAGLHLAADGTLSIADGPRVTTVAPDGTQAEIAVAGAELLGWVGLDGAGSRFVLDRNPNRLVRIDPDGTQEVLTLTTTNQVAGLDVAEDGTVSVLDVTTGEVIRRAPDGTETAIAVPGAEGGSAVDVEGDDLLVGTSRQVVLREADGTTAPILDRGPAAQVLLEADGTAWGAFTGITGCRCPEPAGSVHRRSPGQAEEILPLGDLVDFGSVAAGASGTVLYTSWNGPRGYSDLNPLREVDADGTQTDLPITDAMEVDAAPDGTQYLLLQGSSSATSVLARRSVDGTVTPIELPTEPGIESVSSFSVDADGTLFAAVGSGYGTGPFVIFEVPASSVTPTERYRSDGGQQLLAMAAGGGRLVIAVVADDQVQLLDIGADGVATPRAELTGIVTAFEVDAAGAAIASVLTPQRADTSELVVVDPAGATSAITYPGIGTPTSLSASPDGTLYVADLAYGVISLGQVAGIAGGAPTTPPPATPVPGRATFTG
jgi:sugar lactone lactonase YvrE